MYKNHVSKDRKRLGTASGEQKSMMMVTKVPNSQENA